MKDFRQTTTLTLPQSKLKLECYPSLTVKELADINPSENNLVDAIKMIAKVIKSWDYTNDDGTPVPINEESVGSLPAPDFQFLVEEVKVFADAQKKSSDTTQG